MQNKILFLFGNRHLIHIIIVLITLFVTTTNLQAREIDTLNFGKQSGLYKIVQTDSGNLGEDVIETGLIVTTNRHYITTTGVAIAAQPSVNPAQIITKTSPATVQLADGGTAFVNNTVTQTQIGIRAGMIEYTVEAGESVGTIANRFGITTNSILWANELNSSSYIKPGDKLKIPPVSGLTYEIKSGDTLQKIVEKYQGDLAETMKVNSISDDQTVAVGTQIVIAGGSPPPPPTPVVQNSYIATSDTSRYGSSYYKGSTTPSVTSGGQFGWPVACHSGLTTYWGHPNRARDIRCPVGQPIYASTEGTTYINSSGWGGGYGNSVNVINGNIMTRYAHMSAFNITSGQHVSRGQVIGWVGMTGRTSGPHLHFEIHINGVPQDPIYYIR